MGKMVGTVIDKTEHNLPGWAGFAMVQDERGKRHRVSFGKRAFRKIAIGDVIAFNKHLVRKSRRIEILRRVEY